MRLFAAILFLGAVSLYAQSDRGTITGTITDPTGAVIADAPIEARNPDTGISTRVASSATGNYTITGLPAGTYEIRVAFMGFKESIRAGLQVQAAQTMRIDIVLEVGDSDGCGSTAEDGKRRTQPRCLDPAHGQSSGFAGEHQRQRGHP